MQKNHLVLAIAMIIGAMLACNLPSNTTNQQSPEAVLTAAALTVQAQLAANSSPTLSPANTATSVSSTNTPAPTSAPSATFTSAPLVTATTQCDLGKFVTDLTVPDGTVYAPNTTFTKTWRLQNIGSCTWSGYSLVFDSGSAMGGPSATAISTTPPGAYVDLSVNLTAPSTDGSYRGYWRIRNASAGLIPIQGGYNSQSFYVDIQVNSGSSGSSGPFAVTGVAFTTSGGCGSFSATANITVTQAGTVTGYWQRNDASLPDNFPSLVFSSAGTKSVSTSWATTATGTHSIYLYIDNPNHQKFGPGPVTFTCP